MSEVAPRSGSRVLCIATRNPGKLAEIRALLSGLPVRITDPSAYPDCPVVDEDAPTLEGNAEKKASWVAAHTGHLTLSDDSGLEVDALDGEPGVHSARYAGPECSPSDNITKLLGKLEGLPPEKRTARFRCVIAIAEPDLGTSQPDPRFEVRARRCRVRLHEGVLNGSITRERRGQWGFGYDPVFWIPELGRTLAELALDHKNRLSHRAKALALARTTLEVLVQS